MNERERRALNGESKNQCFTAVRADCLFELSSSLLIFPGQSAEQDAWIAILFGTAGGLALFMMHHFFYQVNPDASPYETLMNIFGKPVGWGLTFIYIVYYCYIAARVLRDFGEMLLTSLIRIRRLSSRMVC